MPGGCLPSRRRILSGRRDDARSERRRAAPRRELLPLWGQRAERSGEAASVGVRVSAWRRESDGAVVLMLHVQPGAGRSEFAGMHGDALKLRLAAPPIEGKANDELIRFLADVFGVPQRNIVLLRGETSRAKTVRVIAPRKMPSMPLTGGFQ